MQEVKRKSKMISLRVSAEEYEVFKQHYSSHGARNLSDFARLAMQRITGEAQQAHSGINQKIQEIDGRLVALEARVALLLEEK
jgi:hypothetical protein